jgi:protein required for attachment to host cells
MASYPISRDHQLHQSASGAADDDEFEQKEDVATGISDILDRYTVEATFKNTWPMRMIVNLQHSSIGF